MNYVYTISVLGEIIYIGCSSDPLKRFKDHISRKCIFINGIAERNIKPKLKIVYHSQLRGFALKKESTLIIKHSNKNGLLINSNYNQKKENIKPKFTIEIKQHQNKKLNYTGFDYLFLVSWKYCRKYAKKNNIKEPAWLSKDLIKRYKFFKNWLKTNKPYWKE